MRWPLLMGLLLLASAVHAEVYRYTDEQGRIVLSHQGVPPQAILKGYEVLNRQGRVIRVVPPPPTAEEIAQQRQAKEQEETDHRLRLLYSSVKDLDTAREHRLRTLDAFVTVIAGNLELLGEQLREMELKAGRQQRAGSASPELLRQVEQLRKDHERVQGELDRRRALRKKTDEEFSRDRARLLKLYPWEAR